MTPPSTRRISFHPTQGQRPEFVELGRSLSFSVTGDQKLHDDANARAYPNFADIPYEDGFRSYPLSDRLYLLIIANLFTGNALLGSTWLAVERKIRAFGGYMEL